MKSTLWKIISFFLLIMYSYNIFLFGALYADATNVRYIRMPAYIGNMDSINISYIKLGQYLVYNEIMCYDKYITTNKKFCNDIISRTNEFRRAMKLERNIERIRNAKKNLDISFQRAIFINKLFTPIRFCIRVINKCKYKIQSLKIFYLAFLSKS